MGKSHLAEYIKQLVLSDRNLFPEKPQVYQIDLKGTIQKHLSLHDALIQLIKSMKPEMDLGDYTSHLSTKISTEQPGFEEFRDFPASFGKLSVLQTDWDSQSAYSQAT